MLIGILFTCLTLCVQTQNTTKSNTTFACLQALRVPFVPDSRDSTYNHLRLGIANKAYQHIRPSAFILCTTSEQVAAAMKCVYRSGMPFVIRSGGGASYAVSTIQPGGVVIDVSGIDDFSLDTRAGTARVGVGLRLGNLMAAIHGAGFVFPAGVCAVAGVSGFVLGAGFGPFERWLGLSASTLLEADVVLANGTALRATASAHSDLLWALRGGGGSFAAVTHLKVALTKAPVTITSLELRWPLSYTTMRKVLRSFFCAKPWTWSARYASVRFYHYDYLRVTMYYRGPKVDVQKLIQSNPCGLFSDAGPYNITIFDELPPTAAWLRHSQKDWNLSDLENASFVDARYAAGTGKWKHWYNAVTFSRDAPPNSTLLNRIVAQVLDPNGCHTELRVDTLGGAVADGLPGRQLAWPGQNVAAIMMFATGRRENSLQLQLPPLKRLLNEVWPHSSGLAHINYMGPHPDAQPDSWKLYYGGNSAALQAVKERYDPQGRFHGLDLPHQTL